jgi:regulator of cell morphogenesis and NO signaling
MAQISTSRAVGELVVERPARARLFEQLGLDYCCGGKVSLAEACRSRGLDADTVAVLLDTDAGPVPDDWSQAPLGELCDHIVDAHHGYLRRELPRLGGLLEQVERAHGGERPELVEVRAVFERLRAELEAHCADEERTLFPACWELEGGGSADGELTARLATFEGEHAEVGALLGRLGELTGGFDTSIALCNTHRATLDGLRELELDLHEHIHEENNVLFPRALALAGAGAAGDRA